MRRVFFALWPDETLRNRLDRAGEDARRRCGGRRMRRETLHLTLAFIGGVPARRIADVEDIGGRIDAPPFELVLDRIEYVPGKRIVWAAADAVPAPLSELVADLNLHLKAQGFRTEKRAFAAHVTLLRNARCGEEPPAPAPAVWRAGEFALVESELKPEGASYRILRRFALKPATAPGVPPQA